MNALKKISPILKDSLEEFLKAQRHEPFIEMISYLQEFVVRGKLTRGSLFLYALLEDKAIFYPIKKDFMNVAMAIELIQSAFLIHDDIMDRADKRRSLPSMHKKLESFLKSQYKAHPDNAHNSVAIAICLGDYLIFLAQELLLQSLGSILSISQYQKILGFVQAEWKRVCLYQIQDLTLSLKEFDDPYLKEQIIELYEGKTARYTFSVPLALAFMLNHKMEDVDPDIINLGVNLGILFQIYDDFLDFIHPDSGQDKSLGTDIKEQKKTLYLYLLYHRLDPSEKKEFQVIINRSDITPSDYDYLYHKMKHYGMIKEMADIQNEYSQNAQMILEKAPFSEQMKQFLNEMINHYRITPL